MKKKLRSAFLTRQYMVSEDFELYYYSDLHFHAVRAHRHDYYEFYLFLEGEDAALEVDGKRLPLQKGTLALIPPGVMHRSVTSQTSDVPYRRFVFWVSRDFAARLTQKSPDDAYLFQMAASEKRYLLPCSDSDFNLIQSRVIRLLEELHSDRYGHSSAVSICVDDLVLTMNRCVYEQMHLADAAESDDLIQNLTLYIEDHLNEDLSLEKLSGVFYVSKYYMAHVFRDTFGIPIHQYIQEKRLEGCRDAILSGEQVTKACADFGFRDYSVFYRSFRRRYGMSPKEYISMYGARADRSQT